MFVRIGRAKHGSKDEVLHVLITLCLFRGVCLFYVRVTSASPGMQRARPTSGISCSETVNDSSTLTSSLLNAEPAWDGTPSISNILRFFPCRSPLSVSAPSRFGQFLCQSHHLLVPFQELLLHVCLTPSVSVEHPRRSPHSRLAIKPPPSRSVFPQHLLVASLSQPLSELTHSLYPPTLITHSQCVLSSSLSSPPSLSASSAQQPRPRLSMLTLTPMSMLFSEALDTPTPTPDLTPTPSLTPVPTPIPTLIPTPTATATLWRTFSPVLFPRLPGSRRRSVRVFSSSSFHGLFLI